MSNIYIKEPSTEGKVLLQTTVGDIDVELWSKEAPLACRNFVQLCMEGYYDGVIFHRVVPGFIVQGGDPTGTGSGGESIYGKPFKDEFHQRLRFVRRGLVAMANSGPNDNTSQFFFTLGPCNDLNKKHTIFGKVTGETVYNMIRLGDVGVGPDERPINPPSIKRTKVLANPFDDIEPRVEPEKKKRKTEEKKKKSQSKATKDYTLLSFGEEAEADEEEYAELTFKGPKSSHDLTNDPRLSSATITELDSAKQAAEVEEDNETDSSDSSPDKGDQNNHAKLVRDKLASKKTTLKTKVANPNSTTSENNNDMDRIQQMRKESRLLARELTQKKKAEAKDSSSSDSENEDNSSNPMFAEYKAQQRIFRDKTAVSKKKGSNREQQTLELLSNFKSKMLSVREEAGWRDSDESDENMSHSKSKIDVDDEEEDEKMGGWLMHKFKNVEAELRDAKDMNKDVNEDRYAITDPRNPINKRRREKDESSKSDRHHRHRDHRHGSSRSDRRDHHRSDRHRHSRR